MRIHELQRILICGALVALFGADAFADAVVIVSAQSPSINMTAEQVAAVFLGKSGTAPDGSRLVPINQPEGTPVRDEFHSRIVGKTPTQVKAYWSKVIFSAKGQPPTELADDTAVRKFVASHPGTIGYVDKGVVDPTVRVLVLTDRP